MMNKIGITKANSNNEKKESSIKTNPPQTENKPSTTTISPIPIESNSSAVINTKPGDMSEGISKNKEQGSVNIKNSLKLAVGKRLASESMDYEPVFK